MTHTQRKKYGPGIVYDTCMTKHVHPSKKHVEGPERITVPRQMLTDKGLLEKCSIISSRFATKEELALVHSSEYIDSVRSYNSSESFPACSLPENWPSYMSDGAYDSASCAAGSAINLVDAICTGKVSSGLALVRPPGHHAEQNEACGFCFFNTVAIATKYAQTKHDIRKVMILDWDIHHGNGIQHAFYSDPRVLYISIHRYDNRDYFPQLPDGNHNYCGVDKGEGFNVNIPWNKDMMGDAEYKMAFDRIILPIANQYKPDLILVAAGFDAAAADPLGDYVVTPDMYAYMVERLLPLVSQRMGLILEGGYSPVAIGEALSGCLEVMLGIKSVNLEVGEPCKRALQTISSVILSQSKHWNL